MNCLLTLELVAPGFLFLAPAKNLQMYTDSEVPIRESVILSVPTVVPVQWLLVWIRWSWPTFAIERMEILTLANNRFANRCGHSLALIALVVFCFVGCDSDGSKLYPVSGKVIFKSDHSVAQFGTIEFRPETEPRVIARGRIEKDGTFELSSSGQNGAVAGWHTVVIHQAVGDVRGGRMIIHDHDHGLEVSNKYVDHRITDLRVEVKMGIDNQIELLVDEKE